MTTEEWKRDHPEIASELAGWNLELDEARSTLAGEDLTDEQRREAQRDFEKIERRIQRIRTKYGYPAE